MGRRALRQCEKPRSSWVRIPILTAFKNVRIGILTHEERGSRFPLLSSPTVRSTAAGRWS
jgi:hypothetical protein